MNLFQIYGLANIYILIFWILYKLVLQNIRNFPANRLYILLALLFSPLMPLIQEGLSALYSSSTEITSSNLYQFVFSSITSGTSPVDYYSKVSPDIQQVLAYFIISGSVLSLACFLLNHIKITRLRTHSKMICMGGHKVFLNADPFVPFIYYNSIFIPHSVPVSDREMIIRHEKYHYKLGHHIDNSILQIIQALFWFNPFVYLLRKEIVLLHEYQVDHLVVASGTDPMQYQLLLIKYKAGSNKFSIANGLGFSNLKKRILIMNTKINQTRNWKYLLLFPAISAILLVLGLTSISPALLTAMVQPVKQEIVEPDSIKINVVDLSPDYRLKDPNEAVIVLMNRKSEIAFSATQHPLKKIEPVQVESVLVEAYKKKMENRFRNIDPSMVNKDLKAIKIIVQKDRDANEENYRELLNKISAAIYSLQDLYSQKLFSKPFKSLASLEIEQILQLIPPVIYQDTPVMVKSASIMKK
ncbi:MAG: M56 family metallopeptidase [Bacteroidota bacterium]